MLSHLGAMLGHAGAILAIDWTVIGDLGADVGASWWQAGARNAKMATKRARWSQHGRPGGSQTGSTWGGGW